MKNLIKIPKFISVIKSLKSIVYTSNLKIQDKYTVKMKLGKNGCNIGADCQCSETRYPSI